MGREAAAWIADIGRGDVLLGFLDDESLHGSTVAQLPVLGGLNWRNDRDDVEVAAAIGSPTARARLLARLEADGISLATIVLPSAIVGPRVRIAPGVIICP